MVTAPDPLIVRIRASRDDTSAFVDAMTKALASFRVLERPRCEPVDTPIPRETEGDIPGELETEGDRETEGDKGDRGGNS